MSPSEREDIKRKRPASASAEGNKKRPEGVRKPRPEGAKRPGPSARTTTSHAASGVKRSHPTEGKAPSKKPKTKEKSKFGKIILFAVEAIVLLVMLGVLWTVLKTEKVGKVELKEEDIVINEEVKEKLEMVSTTTNEEGETVTAPSAMNGYRNIALFGVDSREKALTKNTRSDTIIIASINEETGEVKLVSVFRDTYLNLSNDTYNKCNAAYAKGGPTQAINMLNMNLDLNITDFVTIGFDGLIQVIDALGGVQVNVLESEIVHLNNYQISMVGKSSDGETFTATAGKDYTPVEKAGVQTLNGLQATAYCRIRYVGNDFQRAERQRAVIQAIADKAKQNPTGLASIAESVFGKVYTSLDLSEIIELLGNIAKYEIVDEAGFPDADMRGGGNIGSKGSCVIPLTLSDNVVWLHKFLFGDEEYEPSSTVKKCSEQIIVDTAPYL